LGQPGEIGPRGPGSADSPFPGGIGGLGRPGVSDGPAFSPDKGLSALAKSDAIPRHPPTGPIDQQTLADLGDRVRNNFDFSDSFNGNWGDRYPGAWWAAGWDSTGAAYSTPTWSDYSGYSGDSSGYDSQPLYYDYGSNVVYLGDTVYVNGDAVGTQEQYAEQATSIADAGKQTPATQEEEWLPLGVFAMCQGEQVNGNDLFQLAVNKSGVIRGNYYNAFSDTSLPVYGSVDRKTQRAAWTVGERQEPIYEAGIANLTKSETTILVHFGKERTQQWTLVRIEQPPEN
jgi:hypothetical protein